MKLSVVATFYRADKYIDQFCERMLAAAQQVSDEFELVMVDDGSPDNAGAIVRKRIEQGQPIRLLTLSRNFGHHKAMITGLEHATGDFVFLIDSDLEELPELLLEFWPVLQSRPDLDVVFGVQKIRKGNWVEKHIYGLFWTFFNSMSNCQIPKHPITARLMRHNYVVSLCNCKEVDLFFFGLCHLVGFSQMPIYVTKGYRGETTYSLSRKLALVVDSITTFSAKPLEIIFGLGCLSLGYAVAYSIYLAYRRIVLHLAVEGWTSVIVSIWLLGGLILCALGVLGIYIAKIYTQVKGRPRTVIKEDVWGPDLTLCAPDDELRTETVHSVSTQA